MADEFSPVVDTNLGPPPPQQGGGVAGASGVVGMMSELAEMRNRQNQNLLFQQQMSARHQLGQDLAVWSSQGLTPAEQIERASHQIYAPLVTPELGNLRQSELAGVGITQTQALTEQARAGTEEIRSRLAGTGLAKVGDIFAASGGDAGKLDQLFKSTVGAATPTQQVAMKKAFPALRDALLHNLPDDPEAKSAELKTRAAQIGISVGVPLDRMFAGVGAVPLQVTDMPGGGKSLTGGLPGQIGGSPLVATPPTAAPSPPRLAQDGSPLFAPDAALPPQLRTNLTGTKAFASPMQAEIAQSAAKRWDDAQPMYDQIAQTNATIGSMLAETHNSAKTGGMLTPGFAGESRTTLAKIVNLANDWVNPGAKPVFDPLAVAGNESMEKQARQTAFQLIGQLGGGERGLGVLQNALDSVPSLSKTPLGNIVVGESIQAMGKWRLVQQEYMRDWAARTGGDLTGAEAQYLKDHPPEKVLGAVLAKHGINPAETGEVKASPAKVTHRWNPATGLVEEVK